MQSVRRGLGVVVVGLMAGALLAGCGEKKKDDTSRQPSAPAAPALPTTPPPAPVVPTAPVEPPPAQGEADVTVSAPANAAIGSEFDYALIVRNRSKVALENVVVSDLLPNGVGYVSSEPEATRRGPLLEWTFPSLAAYGTEYLRVKVRVTGAGVIENCASVRADGGVAHEGCATTNVSGGSGTATPMPPTPVVPPVTPPPVVPPPVAPTVPGTTLTIVQTCDPTALVCDPITFRVRVENTGDAAANDVRVASELPPGLIGSAGERTVTLDVGSVAARSSRDMEYQVKAEGTGSYTNTATVSVGGRPRATATCVVRVTMPVLTLRLDAPATASVGETIAVALNVQNTGDGPARAPRITAQLPAGTTLASADGGGRAEGAGVVWDLATLEPGRSAVVNVRLTAAAPGSLFLNAGAEAYCANRTTASARTEAAQSAPTTPLLAVTAAASKTVAAVGEEIEYVIEVVNSDTQPAYNVVVTCRLPEGAQVVSAAGAGGSVGSVAGNTLSFAPVTVPVGSAASVYRVRAIPRLVGGAPLSVSVSGSSQPSPVQRDVPVTVRTAVGPNDQGLSIAVESPAAAPLDGTFECSVVVTNASASDAAGLTVRADLPAGLQYVSSLPQAVVSGGVLSWNAGTLYRAQTFRIAVTLRAVAAGALELCAEAATADGRRPRACVTTTASAGGPLEIGLTCPETSLVCDLVTFRLVTANTTARNVDDVQVTVTFPDGMAGANGERTLLIRAGRLSPRQSSDVTFTGRASRRGTFVTTASAIAAGGEKADSTCTVTCKQPVLQLTATGPAKGAPGESLQYTITVKNTGDAAATDCVIENPVPAGTTFQSASTGGTQDQKIVLWSLGTLDVDATKSVTLMLRADEARSLDNVVKARGYCCDEASATATTSIELPPPDLRVNCVFSKNQMKLDKTGDCTITVVNNGAADATNVEITCALPPSTEAVTASGPAGLTFQMESRKVRFDAIGRMRPGDRAVFTVEVRAIGGGEVQVVGVVRADGLTDPLVERTDTIRLINKR